MQNKLNTVKQLIQFIKIHRKYYPWDLKCFLPLTTPTIFISRRHNFKTLHTISVTRWLYYLFKIWPFTTVINLPNVIKNCQSRFKILLHAKCALNNAIIIRNCAQSGKMSPNLVSLHPIQKIARTGVYRG